MSKYLESICLWEQNEKYLFSFEGFYVKFACKKKGSPSGKGVLERRSVCTAVEGASGNGGAGAALSCHRPALTQGWREPAH